jgi:transcriptional regulator with XRE-family HTH domain
VTRRPSKPPSSGENPAFYAALGRAIKVLRTERGMSRKELAASAGVSYPYLADIESGRGRPSSRALIEISTALELEASELLSAAERFVPRLASEERGAPVAPPAASPSGSWFRTDPVKASPAAMFADEAPQPSPREEIHHLVDALEADDLPLVLDLARRLATERRGSDPRDPGAGRA